MAVWDRIRNWLIGSEINRRVGLAVAALDEATDRRQSASREGDRDRYAYERLDVLRDSLDAWRHNPLARRIVSLTSEYVVGGGLRVESDDEATNAFLQEWWNHRHNRMASRVFEWCDELSRTGELFPLISTDAAGMTYLRAVPAADVGAIETSDNDLEQPLMFFSESSVLGEGEKWRGYDAGTDVRKEDGGYEVCMVHYALNRTVGGLRGESDLAPVLRWLKRHNQWLEDRVRLNHYRQAFMYIVHKTFGNESERLARQAQLNANPPNSGSILVVDESERWDVLYPNLDSFSAAEDGLAVKKQIAAGVGLPLHFIAEPESSTRTTAEQAGGPAFRHFERRQIFFFWLIEDLARIAVRRRAMTDDGVAADAAIKVVGTDIFQRDNTSLAVAGSTIINSFAQLRQRGLIDDEELLRLSYKFAGEVVDVKEVLKDGMAAGPWESEVKPEGFDKDDGSGQVASEIVRAVSE